MVDIEQQGSITADLALRVDTHVLADVLPDELHSLPDVLNIVPVVVLGAPNQVDHVGAKHAPTLDNLHKYHTLLYCLLQQALVDGLVSAGDVQDHWLGLGFGLGGSLDEVPTAEHLDDNLILSLLVDGDSLGVYPVHNLLFEFPLPERIVQTNPQKWRPEPEPQPRVAHPILHTHRVPIQVQRVGRYTSPKRVHV